MFSSAGRPGRLGAALVLALIPSLALCGCLFRKKKAEPPRYLSPLRVVLLPPNVPAENAELRWVSLATTVMLAKHMEDAQDLELVPLWESFPIALETLGASRNISDETPSYVATRLNARWATQAEIAAVKNGISLLIDFMPAQTTMIPYRYQGRTSVESLQSALREALEQFLRYLQARPLSKGSKGSLGDLKQLRGIAEAMDREYGWFVTAEPGKAEKTYASLARTDGRLAQLLFKPSTYSQTGAVPAKAVETTPSSASPNEPPPAAPSRIEVRPSIPPGVTQPEPAPPPSSPAATMPPAQQSESSASARVSEPASSPAKQQAPPAASPAQGKTYWIQVNATRDKAEAAEFAKKLAKAGFKPEVVEVDLKEKGIWYRIRLQGYETRKAAEEVAVKLLAQGIISEYWIVP